jgi:hypothetical protein
MFTPDDTPTTTKTKIRNFLQAVASSSPMMRVKIFSIAFRKMNMTKIDTATDIKRVTISRSRNSITTSDQRKRTITDFDETAGNNLMPGQNILPPVN